MHRAGPAVAQTRDRGFDHTGREAAVARVHHSDRVLTRNDERRAVGGDDRDRETAHRRDHCVRDGC